MVVITKAKPLLKPLVVNIDTVIPFLRAASYASVAQRTTRLEWVEDTGPIRILYALFLGAFGTPGTVAVRTAPQADLQRQLDVEIHHRIDVLVARMEAGPVAVAKYLRDLDDIRVSCLKGVQQQFAEANDINRDVAREWGRSVTFLSTIELGATVMVKGLSQIPGPGWAVGLGYDVMHETITDLNRAGEATGIVTVFTEKAAQETGKEIVGRGAEKTVDTLNKQPTASELKHMLTRVRQLEDKIARQSERLSNRLHQVELGLTNNGTQSSIRSFSQQIPRNVVKLDAAQKGTIKAAGKVALAKTVSWVFLARDVKEALDRHNQQVRDAAE